MKKIIQGSVLALIVSLGLSAHVFAFTQINSQLDVTESNSDVAHLQEFLAANASIYPEGLITGYFGGLTKAAVIRLQALFGLEQVGRVGPLTRDRINDMIASGGWTVSSSDMSGPSFSNVTKTQNNTSTTFTFSTSELTNARIVYHTSPLMFNEGDVNSSGFGAVGGFSVNSSNGANSYHSVVMPNLQANTYYYYTIVATDTKGNVSVWGPNNRFLTTQ